jgi:hypothetical protein
MRAKEKENCGEMRIVFDAEIIDAAIALQQQQLVSG